MSYLNRVMLIGNLTRDPEVTVTPKGTTIANFSIATNRSWTNEAGQKMDEVCFTDCDALGKTGELVGKYLKKGALCYVEGRLKLDQWTDKTTQQKRSKLKVFVENVQFLDRKPADGAPTERQAPPPRSTNRPAPPPDSAPGLDDDVPF